MGLTAHDAASQRRDFLLTRLVCLFCVLVCVALLLVDFGIVGQGGSLDAPRFSSLPPDLITRTVYQTVTNTVTNVVTKTVTNQVTTQVTKEVTKEVERQIPTEVLRTVTKTVTVTVAQNSSAPTSSGTTNDQSGNAAQNGTHALVVDGKIVVHSIADKEGALIYFLSFPKSGRTWMRYMLGKFFQLLLPDAFVDKETGESKVSLDELFLLETLYLLDPHIPKFVVQHHLFDFEKVFLNNSDEVWTKEQHIKYRDELEISFWPEHLKHASFAYRLPSIYLVRDPRDVIISNYFHKMYRESGCKFSKDVGWFELFSASNLWRRCRSGKPVLNPLTGESTECECYPSDIFTLDFFVYKYFRVVLLYHNYYERILIKNEHLARIRYENMLDTNARKAELMKILKVSNEYFHFLEGQTQERLDKVMDETFEQTSFEQMRILETTDAFASSKLRPRNPDSPATFKTRNGTSQQFVSQLGPELQDWMKEQMLVYYPDYLNQIYLGQTS